jgi:tetratricopeptide (TPR) repeat protein
MSRRSKRKTIQRRIAVEQVAAPDTRASTNDLWAILGVCIFLAVVTWLVFGQTLRHEFINYDDAKYVYENPHILGGVTIQGIAWSFTHVYAHNWHPLTWLSHMLDCQFYGSNPGGHHLSNVLLHMATAILLFLFLRQMTAALWRSAFVAAVFAIHPLRVESVAWVAERKDVLSGLFFVLTMWAYVRYARRPWSLARYGLVALLFALGLMCKPMLVTLPFVLLLLDYWPLNRVGAVGDHPNNNFPIPGRLILEKMPLLGLAAASCVATLFAQESAIQSVSLPSRMGNAFVSYSVYLRQLFWPSGLAPFYPHPKGQLPFWEIALAVIMLLAITGAAIAWRKKRPYFFTGWLWYLGMLVPVIGIIQVGWQPWADRYTYLPQIGLCLAFTWGIVDLSASWRQRREILSVAAAAVIAILVWRAWIQTSYWKDSEKLWRHTLAVTENNDVAFNNLGIVFLEQGLVDEAMSRFQKAAEIRPNNVYAHANLAKAFLQKGRMAEAVAEYQIALQIDPNQADAQSALGVTLLEMGRPDESVAHLLKALEINPNYADAHYNLANTFLRIGRVEEALAHYSKVFEIDPNNVEAMNNMAWVLATWPETRIRDGTKSVDLAERADALTNRNNPVISVTLAAAYAEAGRFPDALKTAERALKLATDQGNTALANSIRVRIALYQSGSPSRTR